MIVSCQNSRLAQLLSMRLGKPLVTYNLVNFADTESLVTLTMSEEELVSKTVVLVFQFSSFCLQDKPKYHINNELWQLLLVANTLKQRGVKKLVGLLPYLPYARHDKKDAAGFAGSFAFVGKLLQAAGFDELISCDVHSTQNALLLPFPLRTISLVPFWANFLKQQGVDRNTCIAAPDVGGLARAQALAQELGLALATLEKTRIGVDQSVSLTLTGDVAGKRVVVIDDIIDTAGTALHAYQRIREHGARMVEGCFSHAVLSAGAHQLVQDGCFDKLYVTNSLLLDQEQVPSTITVLAIDEFLANALAEEKGLW
ncbi:ribose-phosphate diphosphokinase [Candidatus Babeliales bacterium]|nr:ribose-phosphate diphosphokinase [Candidatus Babeliales bacterium]